MAWNRHRSHFDIDFQMLLGRLRVSAPLGSDDVPRPPIPRSNPCLPHRALHPLRRAARERRAGHPAARARCGTAAASGPRRGARAARGSRPRPVADHEPAQLAGARRHDHRRARPFALTRVDGRGYTGAAVGSLGLVPGDARGNAVRIRGCPAAVSRNERRTRGPPKTQAEEALGTTPGKPRSVGRPFACKPEDLPRPSSSHPRRRGLGSGPRRRPPGRNRAILCPRPRPSPPPSPPNREDTDDETP
jgi:hypothetical protein